MLLGWLQSIFRRAPTPPIAPPLPVPAESPLWCVVANIALEIPHGPGGAEIRRGTKHFAPGAKVFVYQFYWGTGGERVKVIGRHRKSRRYIRLTLSAKYLANWRAELVYSPTSSNNSASPASSPPCQKPPNARINAPKKSQPVT